MFTGIAKLMPSGGQNPVRVRPILVRDGELDAHVGIREVQLFEAALKDHLFIEVVDTRHGMMGVHANASDEDSAQDDESSDSRAHDWHSLDALTATKFMFSSRLLRGHGIYARAQRGQSNTALARRSLHARRSEATLR
jgi:hypothetical protein